MTSQKVAPMQIKDETLKVTATFKRILDKNKEQYDKREITFQGANTLFRRKLSDTFIEIKKMQSIFARKEADPIQNDFGLYYTSHGNINKGQVLPLPDHIETTKDLKAFFANAAVIELLIQRKPIDIQADLIPDNEFVKYCKTLDPDSKRKVIAESLFDASLLAANANQLRKIIDNGSSFRYYTLLLVLLILSLIIQFLIALLLAALMARRKATETIDHRIQVSIIFLTSFVLMLSIAIVAFDVSQ